MNRQIENFLIIYACVILYAVLTLTYRHLTNREFSKKEYFYKCNHWCIGHIINYFLLGYLAPDYIIYAFIIGILFEYFEIFLSKMIKYVDGDVIKDTIINSIGLFLGYMTYLLFPNNIDLYSYIELLNNSIQI
jgi:hypothetical protein